MLAPAVKKRIYADKAAGVPPPYKGRLNGIVSETICSGIMSFVCGLAVASLALYALHCLGAFDKISQWKNNRKSKNINHLAIKFQFIEQKITPTDFQNLSGIMICFLRVKFTSESKLPYEKEPLRFFLYGALVYGT